MPEELIFEGDDFQKVVAVVKHHASQRYQEKVEWVIFYREIYGVDGLLSKIPVPWKNAILKSSLGREMQVMMRELRQQILQVLPCEDSKSFTVRTSESVYKSLLKEAEQRKVSPNKLYITKLIQFVENDLIPEEYVAEQET